MLHPDVPEGAFPLVLTFSGPSTFWAPPPCGPLHGLPWLSLGPVTCLSVVLSHVCAWLVLEKLHFKWHNYFLQLNVKLPHKNVLWSSGVRKLFVSLRMPYVSSFLIVEILYIFLFSFLPKMSVSSSALAIKFTHRNYADSCSCVIYAIFWCVLFSVVYIVYSFNKYLL